MSLSAADCPQQLAVTDTAQYSSFTNVVQLPGFGLHTETCQRVVPRGVCEAGHIQLATSSCELRRCPDHWPEWATRGTESAVARLSAFREAQSHGWGKRMVHVVLSPEWTSRVTERRLWQRRSEAQQIARDAGLRGGYMVVHPYRTTDELDQLYAEAVDHGLPGDHGKWRFARELTAGRWSHLERYLSVSPHYHVIGPARDVTEADTDRWVVKNIRSLPRHQLEDPEPYEALAGVAWYLRSHAAHQQGRHSASWFGAVHPASFDPAEELGDRWQTVLDMADHAVQPPGAEEEATCQCEDCQQPVFEMYELTERMASVGWWSTLDGQIKNQLLGLKLYWVDGMAVPPPSAATDSELMLSWLERKGWEVAHGPTAAAPSTMTMLGSY